MNHRHVGLIVEDEPIAREELAERVRGLGHDAVAVGSRTEAEGRIREACYGVLDQHIPGAPGGRASSDEGRLLMRAAREVFPVMRSPREFLWPIIAMSGHSKRIADVTARMRDGADAFLAKPIDEDGVSVVGMILDRLQASGIADHDACDASKLLAIGRPVVAPERVFQFELLGSTPQGRRRRTQYLLDGALRSMPDANYYALLRLGDAQLLHGVDAWVEKKHLSGANDIQGCKAATGIRDQVAGVIPREAVLRNDGSKSYSLGTALRVVRIDWDAHRHHPDERIRDFAIGRARL